MEFKFKTLPYQTAAVKAISAVFKGQPNKNKVLYAHEPGGVKGRLFLSANTEIELTDDELLKNIQEVQSGHYMQESGDALDVRIIKQSEELSKPFADEKRFDDSDCNCRCALDVDMETGTGKTYVYIKAIFELNKLYGWSKFIIVVPSVAIREGVNTFFDQTEGNHFTAPEPEGYGKSKTIHRFIYNSERLTEDLGDFLDGDISIMIMNAQAFVYSMNPDKARENKDKAARIMYSKQETLGYCRPIDLIAATRPIVILDEPQSLNGPATRRGIANLNPLFVMNFSATHREQHNLIYVLDALDAYKQKLVKKIEVKGFTVHNLLGINGFLQLNEISCTKKLPEATLTLEIRRKNGIVREPRIVKKNANLWLLSGKLGQYKDYIVTDIKKDGVSFSNGLKLAASDVVGAAEERHIRRLQIRETIRSHFEKEEKLFKQGIKCLSLFFIDHVENYRKYDENGTPLLGDYGKIFEEEYERVKKEYEDSFDKAYKEYLETINIHETHRGYFSVDNAGRAKDSVEKNKETSENSEAYRLILQGKELLLRLKDDDEDKGKDDDEDKKREKDAGRKTRFIFSHSALREGWDNPNVFQICTLKQSNSRIGKRQEVGRGMRLCVDSKGNRMCLDALMQDGTKLDEKRVQDVNLLTVIASESYEEFASALQDELKENLYDRPTKATNEYFIGKIVKINDERHEINGEEATLIVGYLFDNDYIDDLKEGNITDKYREDAKNKELAPLPKSIRHLGEDNIRRLVNGIYDPSELLTPEHVTKTVNKVNSNFYKEEFQKLWERINYRYTYTVKFDSAELIKNAVKAINDELHVAPLRYFRTTGKQKDDSTEFTDGSTKKDPNPDEDVVDSTMEYDLVGEIVDRCRLKRETVYKILMGIADEKFDMFKVNPEYFLDEVANIINEKKALNVVSGINYDKTEKGRYESDIFTTNIVLSSLLKHKSEEEKKKLKNKSEEELKHELERKKHITPYVETDSDIEETVANDLEKYETVCVYAKLPKGRFVIPTPLGDYTPDWAISFNKGTVKHVYFVAETKGSLHSLHLRRIEENKIECTRRLFEQLFTKFSECEVLYDVATSYEDMLKVVEGY